MKNKYIFIVVLLLSIFILCINGINFSALFIVSTIWVVYIGYILRKITKNKSTKTLNIISKTYSILVILFLALFLIIEVIFIINISQFKEPKYIEKLDYVIVLGAGLDGYEVGKTLQSRLDRAIEYYNLNKDVNIIVSGGQGKDEITSEADAMYRYLVKHNVDKSKIIKEDKATTTLENMEFSKAILKDRNDEKKKVLIVTNEFHLTRSQAIANILGIKNEGLASNTPIKIKVNYMIREYPTMIIDMIRATKVAFNN